MSDDIEYEAATEDAKREGTCRIIFLYLVSFVSIRGYPQMALLKKIKKVEFLSTPVKLLPHCSLKETVLTSHRLLTCRHSDSKPHYQQQQRL